MTTLLPRPTTSGGALTRRLPMRLLQGLTWPHGVDGYRDAFRPGAGAGAIAATVEAVIPRTARANSLVLLPEQPMAFTAGQHVLVTTEIAGARRTRCYSLSDTPHRADGRLEITVAHLPEGLVSSHLTGRGDGPDAIRVGDTVGLSAPQGIDFTLPRVRPDHLVLIGGGSGITPLRAMWRTMAAEGLRDRVTVRYYARTASDAIFADELAALPGATVVLTREGGERFTPAHLADIDLTRAQVFACGPGGLVDAVRAHAEAVGVADRLATESFAPPVAPSDPATAEGILTFARAGATAVNTGGTLLDQAEAAGLTPQAGCRMGICHSCITTKHAGVVKDIRTGACDDGGEGEIQLCITQAVGDVQLDL